MKENERKWIQRWIERIDNKWNQTNMSSTNPNVPSGVGDADQTSMDAKALPKDALVIIEILKDMGIEHDQKVITHLLEFLYR